MRNRRTNGARTILALVALAAAELLDAQDMATRTVTVKLAADRDIANMTEWKLAAVRLLDDCFRTFQDRFDIRLKVESIVTWRPTKSRATLLETLGDLRASVAPGRCDIVLGIVTPERIDNVSLGVASYPFGYMLVKNIPSREAMVYAVLHELCHVFGAIDLHEKGSIMGIETPGFEIDAFTLQAVRLHRGRLFQGVSFPLPKKDLGRAAALFAGRAGLGLKEPEVHLFLTLFHIEMNDLAAAARDCEEAVREDPNFSGLRVLLGNVSIKLGEADEAIGEYKKALEVQPREPGIHFNLGLAYVQKGGLAAASAEFERALEIYPGYLQARQALDRIHQTGQENARLDLGLEPVAFAVRIVR